MAAYSGVLSCVLFGAETIQQLPPTLKNGYMTSPPISTASSSSLCVRVVCSWSRVGFDDGRHLFEARHGLLSKNAVAKHVGRYSKLSYHIDA